MNLFADLAKTGERFATKKAIIAATGTRDAGGAMRYTHLTYAELVAAVVQTSAALAARGIVKGTRVLMLTPPSIDFVVLAFALFRNGAVPVFLDPGHPLERLLAMVKEAEPEAIVGVEVVVGFQQAFPDAFASVKEIVVVGSKVEGHASYEELRAAAHPPTDPAPMSDDEAMTIVYTSGSTGIPKGVEFTPGMFRAILAPLTARYGIDASEIDLVTFPINLLTTPTGGATLVLPAMDFASPAKSDPALLVEAIRDHGCTNCLGSPTLWARIAAYCIDEGITLPTMRRVLLGGAPVPAGLLSRLQTVTPNGVAYTPIGATECGPIATIAAPEILGETLAETARGRGVCVGYSFDDHDVEVIRVTTDPIGMWSEAETLARGEIGEIVIRGPAVSPRYFRREEANRRAKIADGASTWHRTGDVGYVDGKGRLWFCGRVAQILDLGGERYFPAMAEGIFSAAADVARAGLVAVGGTLVLCVEFHAAERPVDASARLAALAEEARSAGYPVARAIVNDDGFPVDARHNAKIEYGALTKWATAKLAELAS